jgi:hypothetical protein
MTDQRKQTEFMPGAKPTTPSPKGRMLNRVLATIALGVSLATVGIASARTLAPIMDPCSDPLASGPQETAQLSLPGWSDAGTDPEKPVRPATTHMVGFTNGMPGLDAGYAAVPLLANNFANMIDQGRVSLRAKTYGEPTEIPELEIIGARFNEDAFTFNDDQTGKHAYIMYSSRTRITSTPARGPLTDGYRLERLNSRQVNKT